MYRVKWNTQHTDGYKPAQHVDAIRTKLLSLLKRQRMVFSHTEGGFEFYAPLPSVRRSKPRPKTARRVYAKPKLQTCNWRYRLPTRLRSSGYPWRHEAKCPLHANVFLGDYKWDAYCELHADKAIRMRAYFEANK